STLVMQEYFKGMEAFLDTETQVMEAFLNRGRTPLPALHAREAVPASPKQRKFPLLGSFFRLVPGQELTAVRELTLEEDLFLRDHALGSAVSVTDPELRPMIVLPLTMSLEILAEAAAALVPGKVLLEMRDVQAHHWVRVDDTPVKLEISARRLAGSNDITVYVRNVSDPNTSKTPVIQGIVSFGDQYPPAPAASIARLNAERASRLASAQLYGRLMFHGPCFQGVARIERSGQDGIIGQLRTLPTGNLFRSDPSPQFVTDPVLLDAAGQLVGFWTAEYLERGFVVFPYHLEKLRIYGPNRPAGESVACTVKLQLKGNEAMRSDIEIVGADGLVWMKLEGWADRRFDPPPRFHQAWIAPREGMISHAWQAPLDGILDKGAFACCRLEPLFQPGAALWKELWASLVLSRRERQIFRELSTPEPRQLEWLSLRTAAKDAVRSFLGKYHGLELLPADIEIAEGEDGNPIAQGPWTHRVPTVPALSWAQSEGMTVALAGDASGGRGLGIGIENIRDLPANFETSVFTNEEQHLLDGLPKSLHVEWLLRLWSAKQALWKAAGSVPSEEPASVRILSLNLQTGMVTAAQARTVTTVRDGDYVVATAIYEKRNQ
ncbi:MAG: polyketide synthase dehydratase domain-containing protein, partial [Acidobacteriia bacterium]|nr:polyketide synthase dehydratase domain-containing protein [Terriglobia bacterium]